MKKEVFLAIVLASVLELKAKATPEEIGNLNYNTLRPTSQIGCLLGQMTGNYENERALELAPKTVRVNSEIWDRLDKESAILNVSCTLWGGSPDYLEKVLECIDENPTKEDAVSPIELFICFKGANTEDLFKFLKGETESFTPTFVG